MCMGVQCCPVTVGIRIGYGSADKFENYPISEALRRPGDPPVTGSMSPAELEAAIRAVGAERYHDKHPFHRLLHSGRLDKGQVQAWALNRYCYQSAVPRKDAALIARVHDRDLRREWVHRLIDHDGSGGEEGGIERW